MESEKLDVTRSLTKNTKSMEGLLLGHEMALQSDNLQNNAPMCAQIGEETTAKKPSEKVRHFMSYMESLRPQGIEYDVKKEVQRYRTWSQNAENNR